LLHCLQLQQQLHLIDLSWEWLLRHEVLAIRAIEGPVCVLRERHVLLQQNLVRVGLNVHRLREQRLGTWHSAAREGRAAPVHVHRVHALRSRPACAVWTHLLLLEQLQQCLLSFKLLLRVWLKAVELLRIARLAMGRHVEVCVGELIKLILYAS